MTPTPQFWLGLLIGGVCGAGGIVALNILVFLFALRANSTTGSDS